MPTREQIHEAFVVAVNHIEPEHSHYNDTHKRDYRRKDGDPLGMWPMELSELHTSYCRSDGSYYAKAGPRSGAYKASFSINHGSFKRASPARRAACIVHEVTHITVGRHTTVQGGMHPPRFWETFAEYALRIADDLDILFDYIGAADRESFLEAVCDDPNDAMVDGRYETLEQRQDRMRAVLLARDTDPKTDVATTGASDETDEASLQDEIKSIQEEAAEALD